MSIRDELIEELMKEYKNPEDLLGRKGILAELKKRLIERAMKGELTHHLGHEKNEKSDGENYRNGSSPKTVLTENEKIGIEVPRDRNGTYDPQIVKKHQRRFDGFDAKIISMYARGMTTRDIQGHLLDMYHVEVSPELISEVTDSVVADVKEWQNRPLDPIYPIVFMDAIFIKAKDNGHIVNKSVYFALGVNLDGKKELLGMWVGAEEGAKFWLNIITELKNRGLIDIFIACVDGLKGFPEAISSVFPKTEVQVCIVHMLRNSMRYVSWKDKKAVAKDLKKVYTAANEEQAKAELAGFKEIWGAKYPSIAEGWERNWTVLTPYLAYPQEIRKVIYTTNSIESMNRTLRKVTRNRGMFPNDEAVLKLMYLALKNASRKWTMPIRNWGQAMRQFSIMFGDRVPMESL
jgi:putative transposase